MSEVKDIAQHPNVEIAVKNFGPIVEANIDLRPLTVFVGPSNTGKTYFATLVYALHGVFEGFSGLGLLAPVGFGVLSDIMSDLRDRVSTDSTLSEENIQDFLKKLRMPKRPFKLSDLPETMRSQWLAIIKNSEVLGDELHEALLTKLKNCFDLNSVLALRCLTVEGRSEMTISLKVNDGNQGSWSVKLRTSKSDITLDRSVDEDIILLPQDGSIYTETLGLNFTLERRWGSRSRYYLPAARSGIMQSHRVIASSLVRRTTREASQRHLEIPTLSGAIADFMEKIILYEEDKTSNDEMKHLAETLESDVLVGQVRMKPSPGGYPNFCYRPRGVKEDMPLSQASSMVSELAPLVLFLRNGINPGDTLIIEEPEAHLHPGAQADMATILVRMVRAGVRVIVTTHSDWLLEELANLTLEGLLAEETDELASWLLPEEVGVWHFQRDEPVKEIPFHPRSGISPEDYEDVSEGLYNRSVNLQQKYEKQKGGSRRESAPSS